MFIFNNLKGLHHILTEIYFNNCKSLKKKKKNVLLTIVNFNLKHLQLNKITI